MLVLFCMPAAIPVTLQTMNWASAVFAGFMFISLIYYVLFARKCESSDLLLYRIDADTTQITLGLLNLTGSRETTSLPYK